jgi:hypothetical protein
VESTAIRPSISRTTSALAVDILDAWIQQAERVEKLSSELWDLRNQLNEIELELRRPTHSQLESSRSRTVTSPKPRRKKSSSSRVYLDGARAVYLADGNSQRGESAVGAARAPAAGGRG